jgi:hypothetical protein
MIGDYGELSEQASLSPSQRVNFAIINVHELQEWVAFWVERPETHLFHFAFVL